MNSIGASDVGAQTTILGAYESKTDAEMQIEANFVNFDFTNIWSAPSPYPYLKWED